MQRGLVVAFALRVYIADTMVACSNNVTSFAPGGVAPLLFCSVLFCKFYIRWRPIKASDELVGEL
jgi:hypothetical protein